MPIEKTILRDGTADIVVSCKRERDLTCHLFTTNTEHEREMIIFSFCHVNQAGKMTESIRRRTYDRFGFSKNRWKRKLQKSTRILSSAGLEFITLSATNLPININPNHHLFRLSSTESPHILVESIRRSTLDLKLITHPNAPRSIRMKRCELSGTVNFLLPKKLWAL